MNTLLKLAIVAALTASVAHAAESRTAVLEVTNMTCAACPITVRMALERVPGVTSAKVDLKTKRATVVFDPSKTRPESLAKATADAGFPSALVSSAQ